MFCYTLCNGLLQLNRRGFQLLRRRVDFWHTEWHSKDLIWLWLYSRYNVGTLLLRLFRGRVFDFVKLNPPLLNLRLHYLSFFIWPVKIPCGVRSTKHNNFFNCLSEIFHQGLLIFLVEDACEVAVVSHCGF